MKNKTRIFHCPSCLQNKKEHEISKTVKIITELREKKALTYYANVGDNIFDKIPLEEFEWACNECLGRGKAVLTNPLKQKYVDYRPYLAYYDSIRECENCTDSFTFKKEEKRFWYEELNFWVQSKPRNCISCRKDVRKNNKLSNLLSNGEKNLTKNELNQIITIYHELGKTERMKYFQSILSKKNWL